MKRYKYLRLNGESHLSGKLYAVSTNSEVLDWIVQEAKRSFPKCKVESERTFSSGERYEIRIINIHGISMLWWIIRELCNSGWEPFGDKFVDLSYPCMQLRLETKADQEDKEDA